MKKYKIIRIVCLLNFCILFSCTNLDETVYSERLKDNFYKSEAEIISALAPAYGGLRGIESLWEAAALATDEAVIPTRGKDWYDGGIYLRLHEHNWQPDLSYFSQIWSYGYGRVNKANQLIYQLAQVEDK